MYAVVTESTRGKTRRRELHFAHERSALPRDRRHVERVREMSEEQCERIAREALKAGTWVCWCDPQLPTEIPFDQESV